jgi:hypothetical protein
MPHPNPLYGALWMGILHGGMNGFVECYDPWGVRDVWGNTMVAKGVGWDHCPMGIGF